MLMHLNVLQCNMYSLLIQFVGISHGHRQNGYHISHDIYDCIAHLVPSKIPINELHVYINACGVVLF